MDCRSKIILDFARWAVLSALRSGSPVKSRNDIYPLLDRAPFPDLLQSIEPITTLDFDAWHEKATHTICRANKRLQVGWAAKMINIYMKTAAYIGGLGTPRLRAAVHPPVDRGLWDGLAARFSDRTDIIAEACCVRRIAEIADYRTYQRVVNGCRMAASLMQCQLIEVEQLWLGAITPPAMHAVKPAMGSTRDRRRSISHGYAGPRRR